MRRGEGSGEWAEEKGEDVERISRCESLENANGRKQCERGVVGMIKVSSRDVLSDKFCTGGFEHEMPRFFRT